MMYTPLPIPLTRKIMAALEDLHTYLGPSPVRLHLIHLGLFLFGQKFLP